MFEVFIVGVNMMAFVILRVSGIRGFASQGTVWTVCSCAASAVSCSACYAFMG